MKIFIILIALILSSFVEAQQYVQKQDTQVINKLVNPGYENGKASWFISVSSTAIASQTNPIQDSTSLIFDSTATSQTVRSDLYSMPITRKGNSVSECQASIRYLTDETTNKYICRVLDGSNVVVSTITLNPVSVATVSDLFFSCPTQARIEIISTGNALPIKLDSGYLGSRKDINSADVLSALGYSPVSTVTASSPLTITGGASNPVVALQTSGITSGGTFTKVIVDGYGRATSGSTLISSDLPNSGVTSGTYTKVQVDQKGVVTSGTTLVENDIPSLQTTKVTSGVFSVARGGTGVSTTATGSLLVGSGSSFVNLPIGPSGRVLTANTSGTAEWATAAAGGGDSGVNLNRNDFELDVTTGWVTSGVTVARQAFQSGTQSDAYYASMTATVSGAYYETSSLTISDNMKPGNLEFGGQYLNATGTWRADWYVSGTVIASQTLTTSSDWGDLTKVFQGISSAQTTTKARFTSLTSGTATLGLNKIYLGSLKSFSNGAIIGPVTKWTPTFGAGFGTPPSANVSFHYYRDGNYLIGSAYFINGTAAAAIGSITLPDGLTIDTSVITVGNTTANPGHKVGEYKTSSAYAGTIVTATGTSTNTIYLTPNNTGSGFLTPSVNVQGNVVASSLPVSLNFTVPIKEWAATGTSIHAQCPTAISCNNVFSAKIDAAGNVTGENLDWLSGNCGLSTSTFTCTFNTSIFTTAPNCWVSPTGDSQILAFQFATTSSNVSYRTRVTSTFADSASGHNLFCQKTGADFVARKEIVGTFTQYDIVAASYWLSANQALTGGVTPINFDSKEYEYGGANVTTGAGWKFIAPSDGIYEVELNVNVNAATHFKIYKNGTPYKWLSFNDNTNNVFIQSSTSVKLNKGDYIDVRTNNNATATGGALSADNTANIVIKKITGNPVQ